MTNHYIFSLTEEDKVFIRSLVEIFCERIENALLKKETSCLSSTEFTEVNNSGEDSLVCIGDCIRSAEASESLFDDVPRQRKKRRTKGYYAPRKKEAYKIKDICTGLKRAGVQISPKEMCEWIQKNKLPIYSDREKNSAHKRRFTTYNGWVRINEYFQNR